MRGWLRGVSVFIGISCFGIMLAAIAFEMHERGLLVDELVTGSIVITDVMSSIIILFMIVAGVLAVAVSR